MGAEPRKVLPPICIMPADEYPVCFRAFDLRNLVMAVIYIPRVQLKNIIKQHTNCLTKTVTAMSGIGKYQHSLVEYKIMKPPRLFRNFLCVKSVHYPIVYR